MNIPTRRLKPLIAAPFIVALIASLFVPLFVSQPSGNIALAQPFTYATMKPIQKRIVSGLLSFEMSHSPSQNTAVARGSNYHPTKDDGCSQNIGNNIKVNQNCLNISDSSLQGRGQAQNETSIAQDPFNPNHLVASFNDYRRGDGNCYTAYSLDRGRTWIDSTPPMSFTSGTAFGTAREYWQAGGDTSVAWDTKGNAYLSCQMFNRGSPVSPNPDQSSAFFVFRSTGNDGASWNFPARPAILNADAMGTSGVLIDKALMTVDNHVGSPFQDRVYVTWTTFAADGTAYIYETSSNDYGEHFTAPVLVSSDSNLCPNTFGVPTPHGRCNENQFSQPFTAPDGTLYVTWASFNNSLASATDNHNQILLAKSTDGGATFSAPVLVANYYDLPDCATYQGGADFGRACVPEKGSTTDSIFRATNYPSGAVDPSNPSRVAVTVGSYINVHSNEANGCTPNGFAPSGNNAYSGVKTPGACNNDILLSVSNNAGASFTGGSTDPRQLTTVTQASGQATSDQFWQWATYTVTGKLVVSYYDRQYGSDETTGFLDFSLSSSRNLVTFATARVTSSSMAPPTEFSGLFFGDYTGLTAFTEAHPLWMDTRNQDLFLCPGTGVPGVPPALCTATEPNGLVANDQDVFTANVHLPDGG